MARWMTRWMVGIPSSLARVAACFTTSTALKVGSVTSTAWSNPSAIALPKCSTPASGVHQDHHVLSQIDVPHHRIEEGVFRAESVDRT